MFAIFMPAPQSRTGNDMDLWQVNSPKISREDGLWLPFLHCVTLCDLWKFVYLRLSSFPALYFGIF